MTFREKFSDFVKPRLVLSPKPQKSLQKASRLFKIAFPYLFLLGISFLPIWFWFTREQITSGDDVSVHLSLVYDILYGFEHGFFDSTNHVYMGNLAVNVSMFYGLLFHYVSAICTYLFGWMGLGINGGIKMASLLFIYAGAVFSYKFGKRATGREVFGLAAGIVSVFFPYRNYCLLCRFAVSEAAAISLIPGFFYSLYCIVNSDKAKVRVSPYVILSLSTSALIYCHAFTAMITVACGAIYVLANIHKIVMRAKNWKYWVYLGISILSCILIVFPFVFPMMQAVASGEFRVSNEVLMHYDHEYLMNAANDSLWRTGFINLGWIKEYIEYAVLEADSLERWVIGLIVFPILCIVSFVVDRLIAKKDRYWKIPSWLLRFVSICLFMLVYPAVFKERAEIWMSCAMYLALFSYYFIFREKDELAERMEFRRPMKKEALDFLKQTDIYAFIVILPFGFVLLFYTEFWEIAPLFLRECQFPFRFWGIVGSIFLFTAFYLFRPFRRFRVSGVIALTAATVFASLNQGMVEKRISSIEADIGWIDEPNLEYVEARNRYGFQNEYFPQIIWDIYEGDVSPSYPNSLAKTVGTSLVQGRPVKNGIEEYVTPVFLEGEGTVEIYYLNTPDASFNANCLSDSLVHFPQTYYDGYQAMAVYEDGLSESLPVRGVDGFLAVEMPEGDYKLEITYPGPTMRRVGRYLAPVGGLMLAGIVGYEAYLWLAPRFFKKSETPEETESEEA